MTLIVGIKCEGGVVMGADSAATSVTTTGQQTSMQPTEKLCIIEEKIIVGTSAYVGLAQFFEAEIKKLWDGGTFSNIEVEDARVKITEAFRKHLTREIKFAEQASRVFGSLPGKELIFHTLIAIPIKHEPMLLEFTTTGASEEKRESLPTVAIGSAQPIADPFLYFLRKVFWPDRLPNIGEGKLAAYWALKYSIEAAPGNVGFPIKIATLEKSATDLSGYNLDKQELDYLEKFVNEAEEQLQEFYKMRKDSEIEKIEIPKP